MVLPGTVPFPVERRGFFGFISMGWRTLVVVCRLPVSCFGVFVHPKSQAEMVGRNSSKGFGRELPDVNGMFFSEGD